MVNLIKEGSAKGFILKNDRWLMPKDFANYVWTEFNYSIPKSGLYQIDLLHPYVPNDANPSYRISILGKHDHGIVSKRLVINEKHKDDHEIVTPVTLAYLSEGDHKGYIGGKFFVGLVTLFSHPYLKMIRYQKFLKKKLELTI